MEIDRALEFIANNHRGVLATRKPDGEIQMSPILANVDDDGRVIISSRETAFKVKNLRRDPAANVCVFVDEFFGDWVQIDGPAEVISLPEAMDLLIDYYKRFPDSNPDWDDYRERMRSEQRVLIRIEPHSAAPDEKG
ncbi:MAG: PPOX class F420-dependent oxidoreductase [Solirubrobacterales bacterium]